MSAEATWLHLQQAHGFYDWSDQDLADQYPSFARADGRVDVAGLHDRDHQEHAADLDHPPPGDMSMTGPAGSRNVPRREWLTSTGAAEILHVSAKTVQRWAKEGKLPYQRTLGGHRRFSEATLRELVDASTVPVSDADARRLHP